MDPAPEDVADRGEFLHGLGRTDVPVALAEVPAEPASPAAMWAFGLLFVGFCAWIVLAMMKSNKSAAEQKTEDK